MSNLAQLIPVWIIGAPMVFVILSSFMFGGKSSMSGQKETPLGR